MIHFARLGLLLAVLAFSVNANEKAKAAVRERALREKQPIVQTSVLNNQTDSYAQQKKGGRLRPPADYELLIPGSIHGSYKP